MHITFVGFGWEQLGIAQLSAIARHYGHGVGLAFSAGLFDDRYNLKIPFLSRIFNDDASVLAEINRQKPDVLVFSPLTATYQWMLAIAESAKSSLPDVKTVFGGVHVSAVPDRVILNDQVDYLCVGEGDTVFVHILKAIEKGRVNERISNVWFKTEKGTVKGGVAPFVSDLDSLPFFDKTLWEEVISFRDIYFTIASRGCPFKCAYCFNDFFAGLGSGPYVRYRSPEHVIRELQWAKRRYRLRLIEFEDDVFTMNKAWLKRLMDLYKKEIGIPFQCLTHPKCMDGEIAGMLAVAGCRYVQIGIQSMDEEYKRKVMKRSETNQDIERALSVMKQHGLHVKIDHMFALPGEPIGAQGKALEMYRRYPPYRMQTFWTNYFPGTSFINTALECGILTLEEKERIEEGMAPDYYRNSEKLTDQRSKHVYKAYECCFKMLTIVPVGIAGKFYAKFFLWMPDIILSGLSFLVDLISGLIKKNPDHWAYARYYFSHISFFVLRAARLK